jgi:hypothetical protein
MRCSILDSAYMMSFNMKSPDRLTTQSDAMGHFEFKNVSPGPRIISCSAEGFERQIDHSLNFTGEANEKRVKDFRLGLGYPIAGRVFGPQSEGVKGANVIALNYGSNVSSRGESLTDDDGNFQIDGLAQGSYILMIEAKGYRAARQNRVQVGDLNLQIEMLKQNTLTGRVFELANNKPIESFTVQLLHVNTAIPIQGHGAGQLRAHQHQGEDLGCRRRLLHAGGSRSGPVRRQGDGQRLRLARHRQLPGGRQSGHAHDRGRPVQGRERSGAAWSTPAATNRSPACK